MSPAALFKFSGCPHGNDVAAVLIFLLCFVFFLYSNKMHTEISPNSSVPASKFMFWPFLFAAGVVGGISYWHFAFAKQMTTLPIDSKYADMLPLMLEGFKDLENLRSPFRPHKLPWTLQNYYLPATFIPYFIAHKLGIDIRWTTVFSIDLIGVVLALAFRPWRLRGGPRLAGLLIWFIAYGAICYQIYTQRFVCIIQLGPFWLWTAMGFTFLGLRAYRLMSACFLLALVAREAALFYLLAPIVIGMKFHRRQTITCLLWLLLGVFTIFSPFLIDNPLFYLGNIKQYSSLGWYLGQNQDRFIGFSALLQQHSLDALRFPLLGVSLIVLCILAWRKSIKWNYLDIITGGFVGVTLFYLFALITWEYTYVCSVIILAVWFCNIWSGLLDQEKGQM